MAGEIWNGGIESSILALCQRALVMAKSASRAKRILENPANPVNPDFDKDAQPRSRASQRRPQSPRFHEDGRLWIPAFAGMAGDNRE